MLADSGSEFTLAEEFFLIAHDDHTGRGLLDADVLAVGLAGAVLAGLVLAGRVTVLDGKVALMDERPAGDPNRRSADRRAPAGGRAADGARLDRRAA